MLLKKDMCLGFQNPLGCNESGTPFGSRPSLVPEPSLELVHLSMTKDGAIAFTEHCSSLSLLSLSWFLGEQKAGHWVRGHKELGGGAG